MMISTLSIQRACSQVDELHIIMGFDDTRDRALFEDSATSQQPTVPDRLRWRCNL